MSRNGERQLVQFVPLRPASRGRLIAAFVLGPLGWLLALMIAAALFHRSWAITVGLLVTVASFLVSLLVLALLHALRMREERRYADRG